MKVQHSIVNNNKLNTVPVTNGQIIYVKDTHDLYFDVNNTRTKATDIIFVDTMQDRGAIQSPLSNKVYCVLETNCFYKYANNNWVLLGGDVTKSYVDTQDGATLTGAQNYADTNFLKKNNTTEFTPTANYHPATKKYVDDNCIPYQPFPAELDTSHTTPDFITSIRALSLPAGSTYLGGVTLTDMPFNGNAEVEIYVYPSNVIYLILRSANVSPYMWECNSHTYRGWEAVGKAYTDSTISTSVIKTGSTVPTTSTVGYRVGQLYLNTTDNSVYQLTAIDDTDPNAIVYTWQQLVTASYLTTALNNFTPASTDTTFDNTGTDMSSTNVEDAIIELNNKIGSLNTLIEEINGE